MSDEPDRRIGGLGPASGLQPRGIGDDYYDVGDVRRALGRSLRSVGGSLEEAGLVELKAWWARYRDLSRRADLFESWLEAETLRLKGLQP
jgi:hypothetical protein